VGLPGLPKNVRPGLRNYSVSAHEQKRWLLSKLPVRQGVSLRTLSIATDAVPPVTTHTCSLIVHLSSTHPPIMSSVPTRHITTGDIIALSITGTFVLVGVSLAIAVLIGIHCMACRQQHSPTPIPIPMVPINPFPIPMARTERHQGTPRPNDPSQGPGSRV
jgi:hypothetical protein